MPSIQSLNKIVKERIIDVQDLGKKNHLDFFQPNTLYVYLSITPTIPRLSLPVSISLLATFALRS
jgi:hypothetical protein